MSEWKLPEWKLSEWKNTDEKEYAERRSFCELLMGVIMLFLVAVINLQTGFRAGNEIYTGAGSDSGSGFTAGSVGAYGQYTASENRGSAGTAVSGSGYCVVLDAGHGASDPGKIGCNDAKEKDINLAIVQKLKTYLEEEDVRVVLTRTSDEPLYDASASNKKMSDMNARVSIIESTLPNLVISIHQNSYHESSVCGPQVFYYKASEEGKRAAECLQASFDGLEEIDNRRLAKANDNYYLLLHTSVPLVIAECGFLSNPREAELLIQDSYQEKVAWVLHLGILQYLNGI